MDEGQRLQRLAHLSGEPIGRLHQEDVARAAEDLSRIASRLEIALKGQEIAPLLLPHEKERRAGPVLPADDGISVQGMRTEIRISDRERRCDARAIRIDGIRDDLSANSVRNRSNGAAVVFSVDVLILGSGCRQLLESSVATA